MPFQHGDDHCLVTQCYVEGMDYTNNLLSCIGFKMNAQTTRYCIVRWAPTKPPF